MKRKPLFAGPGIDQAGLSKESMHNLRAYGIVTCAQLRDLLNKAHCADKISRLFGKSVSEVRSLVGPTLDRLLLGSASFKGKDRLFPLPSLTGIVGPASASSVLSARRAKHIVGRKKVVQALLALKKKGDLPTRMMLTDWMTEVGDQGRLGSCTGWGSTANREFLARDRLSPLFGYGLAKYLDGRPDLEGSWQYFCFEGFARFGQLHERDYPYTDTPKDLAVEPFFDQANEFKSKGFADVRLDPEDSHLQSLLFKAILSGRLNGELGPQPVSTSIAVYESFDSVTTAQYGLVTVPIDGENLLGGHAMCVVGYIDGNDPDGLYDTDYFLVKNSWGTEWAPQNPLGLPGYAIIPALYFTKPSLHWEALLCLAEHSPVHSGGWLDLLRAGWAPQQLDPPRGLVHERKR